MKRTTPKKANNDGLETLYRGAVSKFAVKPRTQIRRFAQSPLHREFKFKSLHRIIATNSLLYKFNFIYTSQCSYVSVSIAKKRLFICIESVPLL